MEFQPKNLKKNPTQAKNPIFWESLGLFSEKLSDFWDLEIIGTIFTRIMQSIKCFRVSCLN
jgi:hypothetical protein